MARHAARAGPGRAGIEAGRMVLTLLGAAGMIGGAFLDWTRGVSGTHVTWNSLVRTDFSRTEGIATSVGGLAVLLGLVALVGLADRSGRLTRLAAALGVVLFVMFLIEVLRSPVQSLQAGVWVTLAGSVLALIGGLLVPRPVAYVPVAPAAPAGQGAEPEREPPGEPPPGAPPAAHDQRHHLWRR